MCWLGLEPELDINSGDTNVRGRFFKHITLMRKYVTYGKEEMMWFTTVWSIWLTRNILLFEGKVCNVEEMLLSIKFLSWIGGLEGILEVLIFMITIPLRSIILRGGKL